MSTNPNNAVGTNAAYGGRTSVNAFNDDLSVYSSGIMSGWACVPNSGLTVSLGGDGSTRDVAVAQDNVGNKTTINNTTGSPIDVTISAAPASNSRIDSIVAYVDNPPSGSSSVADNPSACGIIVVKGTAAASPTAPNDSTIRTAITADGASGSTAYYVVLANITIASGTTTLTSTNIGAGSNAGIASNNIDLTTLKFGNYSTSEVDTGFTWVDGKHIYKKTINCGTLPNNTAKTVNHGITNLGYFIDAYGIAYNPSASSGTGSWQKLPIMTLDCGSLVSLTLRRTEISLASNGDRSAYTTTYVTLLYTKSS